MIFKYLILFNIAVWPLVFAFGYKFYGDRKPYEIALPAGMYTSCEILRPVSAIHSGPFGDEEEIIGDWIFIREIVAVEGEFLVSIPVVSGMEGAKLICNGTIIQDL